MGTAKTSAPQMFQEHSKAKCGVGHSKIDTLASLGNAIRALATEQFSNTSSVLSPYTIANNLAPCVFELAVDTEETVDKQLEIETVSPCTRGSWSPLTDIIPFSFGLTLSEDEKSKS